MAGDVVPQVHAFLAHHASRLARAGIAAQRVILDPGVGFGKTVEQNFALLARQREAVPQPYPILAGWSRKSSLGHVTGCPTDRRMPASIVAATLAVEQGAQVVRVHDVAETVAALKVLAAMKRQAPTH
jgi:dihydropteroate synthase